MGTILGHYLQDSVTVETKMIYHFCAVDFLLKCGAVLLTGTILCILGKNITKTSKCEFSSFEVS